MILLRVALIKDIPDHGSTSEDNVEREDMPIANMQK
jgi:hypothetical protein